MPGEGGMVSEMFRVNMHLVISATSSLHRIGSVRGTSAEVLIISRRTQCEEHIMALPCGQPVAIDTVVLPLSIQNDAARSVTVASEGHMSLKRAWIMPQAARQLKNVIITNYDAYLRYQQIVERLKDAQHYSFRHVFCRFTNY